jgi:nicotine blue oxidoreductase
MGTSKALLDAGGRSFLSAVVGTLTGGGCDPVLVVVGPDQDAEQRQARASGATVLVNPEPGEGPITSLRLALASLPSGTEGVAFCPVDHPLLQAETVAHLLEVFDAGDSRSSTREMLPWSSPRWRGGGVIPLCSGPRSSPI